MTDDRCGVAASSTTPTAVANMCRSSTPNALPKRGSSRPSVASATAMTTLWWKPSTASTRPKLSIAVGHGAAVEYATFEWVDWFNHRRLLEPIGNIPPAEAEEQYYAAADTIAMAALLTSNGLRQTRHGSHDAGRPLHAENKEPL